MPESISSWGDANVPALRTTSHSAKIFSRPFRVRTSTPIAPPRRTRIRSTVHPVAVCRVFGASSR